LTLKRELPGSQELDRMIVLEAWISFVSRSIRSSMRWTSGMSEGRKENMNGKTKRA